MLGVPSLAFSPVMAIQIAPVAATLCCKRQERPFASRYTAFRVNLKADNGFEKDVEVVKVRNVR